MTHRLTPGLWLACSCLAAPVLAQQPAQQPRQPQAQPQMQQAQQPAPPQTVVVSHWKCMWDSIGRVVRLTDSLTKPIAQELVNEGMLVTFGMLVHDWADEWNVVYYFRAKDKPTFFAAWAELGRRFNQRHPNAPSLVRLCPEHRDLIYSQGPATTPAPAR